MRLASVILLLLTTAMSSNACFSQSDEFIYDSHGKRDPFIPLIGLKALRSSFGREIMSIEDVNFQGIASDAKGQTVIIINGEMLKEGSKLGALEVKRITAEDVIVEILGKEYHLNLYEPKEE